VLLKEIDGEKCEPYELLTVDIEEQHQARDGGARPAQGELADMQPDGRGRVRLEYHIRRAG